MIIRTIRLRPLFAVFALVATLTVSESHAQLGMQAGFVEAFQPDYMNRDMTLFADYLELEEWQQPIVESLLKDYLADFRVGVDGLRDTMRNMKDQIIAAGDQGAIGVIMGPINAWTAEKARLKARFIENLRSQLSEGQMNHWTELERAMRREKELPRGLLSGESIDLLLISRESEVPPEVMATVKPQLLEYEIGLDEALLRRGDQMLKSQDLIKDSMVRQDFATGLAQLELIVATRVALRDFQEAAIETIAAAYGEVHGPWFRHNALAAAFPMVYRPSPLIPYFRAALELPGLSEEQIGQLNALETSYMAAYGDYQSRLAQVLRTEEPRKQTDETRRRMTQGTANATKPSNDAYTGLYRERDALNERTREEIARIVGAELAKQLPGAPKEAAAEVHAPPTPKSGSAVPSLTPGNADPQGSRGGDSKRDRNSLTRQPGRGERAAPAPSSVE
ncbi:MAG: hypothetical protein EXS03_03060 [Phycisphaerales bacterium]|nr:hypothetical protein [Phycisphaerales bacterium]